MSSAPSLELIRLSPGLSATNYAPLRFC
jgi:hypothetical protein